MNTFMLRVCQTCGGKFHYTPGRSTPYCSDLCRFEAKIQRHFVGTNDCDRWIAHIQKDGYARFSMPGDRQIQAHRAAWILANRTIPPEFTVGHHCHDLAALLRQCAGGPTCLHRRCVRLDHLILQTVRENSISTPLSIAGKNSAKEFCINGHALTPDNLIPQPHAPQARGGCRICTKEQEVTRYRFVQDAAAILGIGTAAYRRQYGQSVITARAIIAANTPPA